MGTEFYLDDYDYNLSEDPKTLEYHIEVPLASAVDSRIYDITNDIDKHNRQIRFKNKSAFILDYGVRTSYTGKGTVMYIYARGRK